MSGHSLILAVVLSFALYDRTQFVSGFNVINACALFQDGVFIGSPENCAIYYKCTSNGPIQYICDDGYYFSKNFQNCIPKNQVKCIDNKDDPCAGQSAGTYVDDPATCSGFYYCDVNQGALKGFCPSGQNFKPSTSVCEYDTIYKCEDPAPGNPDGSIRKTKNVCLYFPNGVHFGSTKTCNIWQICINDVAISGRCPDGQSYRASTGSCDYKNYVDCKHVSGDPSIPTTPVVEYCTQMGEKVARDDSCSSFGVCDGRRYVVQHCAKGEFYDTREKMCKPRLNAKTNIDCDRCEGSNLEYVTTVVDGCRNYVACRNGVKQFEGKCPSELYFDEEEGGCVARNPNHLACSTETTTASTPTRTTETSNPPTTTSTTTAYTTTTKSTTTPTTGTSGTSPSTTPTTTAAAIPNTSTIIDGEDTKPDS